MKLFSGAEIHSYYGHVTLCQKVFILLLAPVTHMLYFQVLFSHVWNDSGGPSYFHVTSESKCFLSPKCFPAQNPLEELGAPSEPDSGAGLRFLGSLGTTGYSKEGLICHTSDNHCLCRRRDTEEKEKEVVLSFSSFVSGCISYHKRKAKEKDVPL